jgi:hypothetical protein
VEAGTAVLSGLVAEHGLVKGERIGVDGSTMEANAALRTIVRRDNGESYREMLTRMAKESGIDTPNAEDLARFDRKRKGKTLSNADWKSPTDPEAKIARMKDGTTHLAYKPEHAVDLDTGVVVAAPIHSADEGDTTTLSPTLEAAACNLAEVGLAPAPDDPCDLVADKGYHSRNGLKGLDGGGWKTRIAELKPANGYLRWHGDEAAREAVYANRARLNSGVGRQAMRRCGEMVERSFAHVLDRGGMRRAWLRGRQNVHKRYLSRCQGRHVVEPERLDDWCSWASASHLDVGRSLSSRSHCTRRSGAQSLVDSKEMTSWQKRQPSSARFQRRYPRPPPVPSSRSSRP